MIHKQKENALSSQKVITRFAPSPTGEMHLGNLYSAKFAHDLARDHKGTYLLRFEDIDVTRVRDPYYQGILDDLSWLGIHHDENPIRQRERNSAYQDALEKLQSLGVVYPCFCSRKEVQREIASITDAPHAVATKLYPHTCRDLTPDQIESKLAAGKIPSWRIHCDRAEELTGPLEITELSLGSIAVNHHLLGDAVLARRDIGTSYHLAVVVDDAFQNITHVTRGEDLLESTHLHRILQNLLELPTPLYQHHQLITDDHGRRLAKRGKPLSLQQLKEQGYRSDELLKMLESF